MPTAHYTIIDGEAYAPNHRKVRARRTGEVAELESTPVDDALAEAQVQKGLGPNLLVRVTSFRRRLLDEDNLSAKGHIDLLRYAGIIPGDAPSQTHIEVSQQKVGPKDPEFVRLEVLNHEKE